MCSVAEADDIEDLSNSVHIAGKKIVLSPQKCNKCSEKPSIILRNKDAYCKSCFLSSTTHKFKALLGKHKLIKDGDQVLVYHKGGHPSTTLLSFLKSSLDLPTPKKLRFRPILVYIEQNTFLSTEERLNIMKNMENECKKFDMTLYFTSLVQYVNNTDEIFISENLDELCIEDSDKLELFDGTTLANDLKEIYIKNLLIAAAKNLTCKFIFTPELSTDIATNLLSNVVIGRGSHIPIDAGFCDDRNAEVTILRPLRTFDLKELALFNYYNNLDPVIIPNEKTNKNSIQKVIEKFVNELQSNYSATVTTVLKTGDKLSMQSRNGYERVCRMCKGPIEGSSNALGSKEAMQFSHKISTNSKLEDESLSENQTCFSCSNIEKYLLVKE